MKLTTDDGRGDIANVTHVETPDGKLYQIKYIFPKKIGGKTKRVIILKEENKC